MANNIIMVSRKAMPKPMNHPLEVGRVNTIELILSVTVPNVCPGSIMGAAVSMRSSMTSLRSG